MLAPVCVANDVSYDELERQVAARVAAVTGPVFTTDANGLFDVYLNGLPPEHRQYHNCNCCRNFINKYGGLVYIKDDGTTESVVWCGISPSPATMFSWVAHELRRVVGKAKVTGVFVWDRNESVWGTPLSRVTPKNGGPSQWSHLSGVPAAKGWSDPLRTAGQRAAELKEDFGILCRSLQEYTKDMFVQAVRVLESGALYRSEKAVDVAKWALALHNEIEPFVGSRRNNLIWQAVATAPTGYCHLRTTVISTLLDDIAAGLNFDVIASRWKDKLNPLQYQRPTAPPSEGSIAQAEKTFAATGAAAALQRRFALRSDVLKWLWEPTEQKPSDPQDGLFGHLRRPSKTVKPVALPAGKITFSRFAETVLPTAHKLEILLPQVGAFYGLVTATDPSAPAIIQWDGLEGNCRNPVSWYFYSMGSACSRWGQKPNWTAVTGVFLSPHKWQEPDLFDNHGLSAFFALGPTCQDNSDPSLCLFPEILKSEYRAVRSVIEAHSKTGKVTGVGEVNGFAFQKGAERSLRARVTTAAGVTEYEIDRWE